MTKIVIRTYKFDELVMFDLELMKNFGVQVEIDGDRQEVREVLYVPDISDKEFELLKKVLRP